RSGSRSDPPEAPPGERREQGHEHGLELEGKLAGRRRPPLRWRRLLFLCRGVAHLGGLEGPAAVLTDEAVHEPRELSLVLFAPVGMPASLSLATASTRFFGCGVPGSLAFQTSSSSVPMEKLARTSARCAASVSTSRSRRISVDLVRIENGLACSARVSTMPRVR